MRSSIEIEDISPKETSLSSVIRLSPALDFAWQLENLKLSGAVDLLDELSKDSLKRPILLDDVPFLMTLRWLGSDETSSRVQLNLTADDNAVQPPSEQNLRQALTLASQRFWWELDIDQMREALQIDEYGQELAAKYWPLRPANLAGMWECLLKTVISVQIYPGLATKLKQGLLDFYSEKQGMFDGRIYKYWPSIERIASLEPDDLLGMKFSRQKARYLPALAQMILDQPAKFDVNHLRSISGSEAVAVLDELPGVGPWIAHYTAMRGLPHADVFVDDESLRKLLGTVYGHSSALTSKEMASKTAIYAPYRSFACFYSYLRMYNF